MSPGYGVRSKYCYVIQISSLILLRGVLCPVLCRFHCQPLFLMSCYVQYHTRLRCAISVGILQSDFALGIDSGVRMVHEM